ncbi:TraB/GumN family protein [Propionivibrio dicarboxylicus]|uniref:Uncharacterized conserved protein YbaP, TraB family n=1 Tax=Propionivibrio dicarboxylicus TaxID=83767 RepID=A0A1G8LQ90_9RHOO|nr:TraB/GumN family protein [Propionivibrio dicarboxylicus]SDI57881.1 Uncharacterized conserved protein YbaP, TraB family [Propionivibrio dicarboxylicus]
MRRIRYIILLAGLLPCVTSHAEELLATAAVPPQVCYRDFIHDRKVTLQGVIHTTSVDLHEPVVEKLFNQVSVVMFENTSLFPDDGIFKKLETFPDEYRKVVRLNRVVDEKHIPRLSKLFNIALTRDSPVFISTISNFVASIIVKRLQNDGLVAQSITNPWKNLIGASNVEAVAYAYARQHQIPVRDLESVGESSGLPEIYEIKDQVDRTMECIDDAKCLQDWNARRLSIADHISSPIKSYDDTYRVVMNSHDTLRITLAPRNQRMFKKMMSFLQDGAHALVIVGAAHIGGPSGLGAKLAYEKFIRTPCDKLLL